MILNSLINLRREEWVDDYYYQIAAYALAHQEQHGPIDQGLICICTKDGTYQEFKMDMQKLDEYENKWFEREKIRAIRETKKRGLKIFREFQNSRSHYIPYYNHFLASSPKVAALNCIFLFKEEIIIVSIELGT